MSGTPVHPRVRGEQRSGNCVLTLCAGSSPRARGTVVGFEHVDAIDRFIPACAGNRRASVEIGAAAPVHPRVRGEQRNPGASHVRSCGSSPRARGTVRAGCPPVCATRFIPACAGNSYSTGQRPTGTTVHPRVRGEQRVRIGEPAASTGSSPRARGTAVAVPAASGFDRFIPACAGNSGAPLSHCLPLPVHPRVRGEQSASFSRSSSHTGSSPRARGTVPVLDTRIVLARFIPACAGNSLQKSS